MNSIADFKVLDLPVGAVGTGAVIGGVGDAVTGVVQASVPAIPSWAIKAGLAFATYKYAGKVVGKDAANIGALARPASDDEFIFVLLLELYLSLRLQLARHADTLLLRLHHVLAALRSQTLHIFLQHLHRA